MFVERTFIFFGVVEELKTNLLLRDATQANVVLAFSSDSFVFQLEVIELLILLLLFLLK